MWISSFRIGIHFNLAGTQPSALFGYCLPAPNQLKHKTLSNGLIDFFVGISHRSDFPRRNTFFVLSLEIIPYVLLGVYQEPSDMLVINNI